MYIYIYTQLYLRISVCTYIHTGIYTCTYMYVCVYIYMHVYMYIHIHVEICIYVKYTCMHRYIYIYMYCDGCVQIERADISQLCSCALPDWHRPLRERSMSDELRSWAGVPGIHAGDGLRHDGVMYLYVCMSIHIEGDDTCICMLSYMYKRVCVYTYR